MKRSDAESIRTGGDDRDNESEVATTGTSRAAESYHDRTDVLLRKMQAAAVDRERLMLVRDYTKDADDKDLRRLGEEMEKIMRLCIYQTSRRQLLAELTERLEDAKDETKGSLTRAIMSADEQVKRLEYWSDIRSMAEEGVGEVGGKTWPSEKWRGIDNSGP